jgi:hypothetical protein
MIRDPSEPGPIKGDASILHALLQKAEPPVPIRIIPPVYTALASPEEVDLGRYDGARETVTRFLDNTKPEMLGLCIEQDHERGFLRMPQMFPGFFGPSLTTLKRRVKLERRDKGTRLIVYLRQVVARDLPVSKQIEELNRQRTVLGLPTRDGYGRAGRIAGVLCADRKLHETWAIVGQEMYVRSDSRHRLGYRIGLGSPDETGLQLTVWGEDDEACQNVGAIAWGSFLERQVH